MIKQREPRKSGFGHRIWRLLPDQNPVVLLKISILVVFALQIGSKAIAQGNLVNLYNWSNETRYSGSPGHNVQIDSTESALFYGSLSTNNAPSPFALPILTGSLETVPGQTYEISFTMQNNFLETIGQPMISVGDLFTNFDLPAAQQGSGGLQVNPVNIEFSWQATAGTSDFTFEIPLDTGDSVSLDNFVVTQAVTEAPEISSVTIFGFLGCALLFVRRFRNRPKTVLVRTIESHNFQN